MVRSLLGILVFTILGFGNGCAATPNGPAPAESHRTLHVGDGAPALQVGPWIKGAPVEGFQPGHVYVVEFWAAWCTPGRKSIQRLTELAKQHRDHGVTVVGVASHDDGADLVRRFVERMGDDMGYTVGVDSGAPASPQTYQAWVEACGQEGLPIAFVVGKDGRIAWMGRTLDGLDKVLEQVVADNFDWAAHQREREEQATQRVRKAESDMAAQRARDEVSDAAEARDWERACKLLDALIAKKDGFSPQAAVMKFRMLLKDKKDYNAAYASAAESLAGVLKDDAESLNSIAWTMVDDPEVVQRDLNLALRLALRASEASKFENGMILDTLARAYYERGEYDKAVTWEARSIGVNLPSEEVRQEFRGRLKEYEAARDKRR